MTSELGPYLDIRKKKSTIYALLVSAGYLKPASNISAGMCKVEIPNKEVMQVYLTDICEKITTQGVTDIMKFGIAFFNKRAALAK